MHPTTFLVFTEVSDLEWIFSNNLYYATKNVKYTLNVIVLFYRNLKKRSKNYFFIFKVKANYPINYMLQLNAPTRILRVYHQIKILELAVELF